MTSLRLTVADPADRALVLAFLDSFVARSSEPIEGQATADYDRAEMLCYDLAAYVRFLRGRLRVRRSRKAKKTAAKRKR